MKVMKMRILRMIWMVKKDKDVKSDKDSEER
jgi:hypothetical protein